MQAIVHLLILCRIGDHGRIGWSDFCTLRRLIGASLFDYIGPDTQSLRKAYVREFNTASKNAENFNTILKVATEHARALSGDRSTALVSDVKKSAENFAIGLWGELLYGNPDHHRHGHVRHLSETILLLASSPWSVVSYVVQQSLRLVIPGEPTRSEGKLRAKMAEICERNISKLEAYERNNPNAPLKTIRSLSILTGGEKTGALSTAAAEFTMLNLFGSLAPFFVERLLNKFRRAP